MGPLHICAHRCGPISVWKRAAAPTLTFSRLSDCPPSPSRLKNGAADTRAAERRTSVLNRSIAALPGPEPAKEWFPERWPFLLLASVAVLFGVLAEAGAWPETNQVSMAVLAVIGLSAAGRMHAFVQATRHVGARRCVLHRGALAVVPDWSDGGAGGQCGQCLWDVAIAALLVITFAATAYLRSNPGSTFAAQLAIWCAAVVGHASLAGVVALTIALLIALLIGRQQYAEQREADERHRAQERQQMRARDILRDYEDTGQGWFWETDRRGLLTYVSPPTAQLLGLDVEELIGKSLTKLFQMEKASDESQRSLVFHLSARSAFAELPMRAATDTEERWWSVSGRAIFDQFDNFVGFRGSGTDLTARRRSQENASRLARYDSLTGLANRFEMSQALEKILGSRHKESRSCAIMLLDLDRFKRVNDTMGHPAGDALLKQVARRLEGALGKRGQVGRLGGDEFQVIVPKRVSRDMLAGIAKTIIQALSQPYMIDGQRVIIGVSVGIALAPADGTDSETLIRNSDLALYAAKDGGRGRYHFYAQDLHQHRGRARAA